MLLLSAFALFTLSSSPWRHSAHTFLLFSLLVLPSLSQSLLPLCRTPAHHRRSRKQPLHPNFSTGHFISSVQLGKSNFQQSQIELGHQTHVSGWISCMDEASGNTRNPVTNRRSCRSKASMHLGSSSRASIVIYGSKSKRKQPLLHRYIA